MRPLSAAHGKFGDNLVIVNSDYQLIVFFVDGLEFPFYLFSNSRGVKS